VPWRGAGRKCCRRLQGSEAFRQSRDSSESYSPTELASIGTFAPDLINRQYVLAHVSRPEPALYKACSSCCSALRNLDCSEFPHLFVRDRGRTVLTRFTRNISSYIPFCTARGAFCFPTHGLRHPSGNGLTNFRLMGVTAAVRPPCRRLDRTARALCPRQLKGRQRDLRRGNPRLVQDNVWLWRGESTSRKGLFGNFCPPSPRNQWGKPAWLMAPPRKAELPLLNYCGIGSTFMDYTVDPKSTQTNRFLPGDTHPHI